MDKREGGYDSGWGSESGQRSGGNDRDAGRSQHGQSTRQDQMNDGRWQNDMYDNNQELYGRSRGGGSRGGGFRERNSGGFRRRHDGDNGRDRSYGYRGGDYRTSWGDGGDWRDDSEQQGWGEMQGRNEGATENSRGSERWQQYAASHSGSGGSRGSFSRSRADPGGEREQGRVCSIKEKFGFIRCVDRPGDLFFHLTEAPSDVAVGDEVDFFVGTGGRNGRDCAMQLNVLPPGTVTTEIMLEGHFVGVIEKDIRDYHFMPSTHRAHMMGRSRPHEQHHMEGAIQVTGLFMSLDDGYQSDAPPPNANDMRTEKEDGEPNLLQHDRAIEGVVDQTAEGGWNSKVELTDRGLDGEHAGIARQGQERAAETEMKGTFVTYTVEDCAVEDAVSKLRRGDDVRFRIQQDKISGRRRAKEIVLLKTSKEKREQEQLHKLINSGATKQQGVVRKLTHDYGFLESVENPGMIYFHTAHVLQGSGAGNHLRVGAQAEFWVVPDRTKDRRDSCKALDIKLLPLGSLVLEEEVHQKVTGIVHKPPVVPQRSSFGSARDHRGVSGGHAGTAQFKLPFSIDGTGSENGLRQTLDSSCGQGGRNLEEEEGEDKEGEEEVEGSVRQQQRGSEKRERQKTFATLQVKELADKGVPALQTGDIIEADLWRSKLGGGKQHLLARNIHVLSFGGQREDGVVRGIREGGFGFIKPLGGGDDVYFRLADVCKNANELKDLSEVTMTVSSSGRGDKQRASRIEVLPKGSLAVEVPLATAVAGVVTRDAGGPGQGTITVTDGNALEIPAAIRFPKIATKIKAFLSQTSEQELVFPSALNGGERHAVHQIATELGLAHESRGDKSHRTLHLWKPGPEEELERIQTKEQEKAKNNAQDARERSKNGDCSVVVTFSKTDAKLSEDASQDSPTEDGQGNNSVDGRDENGSYKAAAAPQDVRASKTSYAQRGDLVVFDVMLNWGTMKRKAVNIRVTKRAANMSARGNEATLSRSGGAGGKEFKGVVSLVQTDRHFGFIEVMDHNERVFFHLSEVMAHENDSHPGGAIINCGQEVAFKMGQRQGRPLGLAVRKLAAGTLPLEEALPTQFIGVVVAAPRSKQLVEGNTQGSVEDDTVGKDADITAASVEGLLVVLHQKQEPIEGETLSNQFSGVDNEAADTHHEDLQDAEIGKAQRMLSLAGLSVGNSQETSSTGINPVTGIATPSTAFSRKKTRTKGPPRYSVLRFLAPEEKHQAGKVGAELQRGDMLEFSVMARRGQRQNSQRVGKVSLLQKGAVPCRRAKLLKTDSKGIAYLDAYTNKSVGEVPDGKGNNDAINIGEGMEHDRSEEQRQTNIFFLLKEMVRTAGPLRDGDDIEYMLPPQAPAGKGAGRSRDEDSHAVGAVRIQDLKSLLGGPRQPLNLNLKDLQRGPQVRMAQGPDGEGFKVGHRKSPSLFARRVAVGEDTLSLNTISEPQVVSKAAEAETPASKNAKK